MQFPTALLGTLFVFLALSFAIDFVLRQFNGEDFKIRIKAFVRDRTNPRIWREFGCYFAYLPACYSRTCWYVLKV